jgi:hypothetical protein
MYVISPPVVVVVGYVYTHAPVAVVEVFTVIPLYVALVGLAPHRKLYTSYAGLVACPMAYASKEFP